MQHCQRATQSNFEDHAAADTTDSRTTAIAPALGYTIKVTVDALNQSSPRKSTVGTALLLAKTINGVTVPLDVILKTLPRVGCHR